ncbi:MAG: PepSY domain-containing protein [Planctomycetes bacterium]|nr:PepSY domain-containing protein [Planctomycetota bacterium]
MSVAEPKPTDATEQPTTTLRPLRKRVMHVVRRGHLYLGLFLLPWAIMYGATGFLFNHPEAFADAPTATFSRSELVGTPMENVPSPTEIAQQVVTALRTRSTPPVDYQLVQSEKVKYNREFAFATVKADGREVSLLFDATGGGGTVRSRVLVPTPVPSTEKAPFAIGGAKAITPKAGRPEKGTNPRPVPPAESLVESPLHDRVKAAVPTILERTGFPGGEVTVTSVPDLTFNMSDGSKTWVVTYNAQTGTVSGKLAEEVPAPEELSNRRFLTRLHQTHVYPGERNVKWFWTVIVDVMAFVMVFWGISGIFMWWQIKATRVFGFVILVLSIAIAIYLGVGMHEMLATGAR